jgi:serine protease AprX
VCREVDERGIFRDGSEGQVLVHRVSWALTALALGVLAPLVANGSSAAAAQPATGPSVRAIVTFRPGTSLPVSVVGGKVLDTFSHVRAEYVSAPTSALRSLSLNPAVTGISPNWRGHVTGFRHEHGSAGDGVLAARSVGGDAGQPGVGAGVTVALLDTGVNNTAAINRSSGRLIDGINLAHLSAGGPALTVGPFRDGYGHGTFLASLIAGGPVPGSGNIGIGIAPAAHIVVVKVAGAKGTTSLLEVLAGLDWVATHASSIQVVNLSLAVDRPTAPLYGSDPLTAAVEAVRAAGVLVVAAVGNTPGEVGDPGMDPQALTVGAVNVDGWQPQVSSFAGSGVVAGVVKPDVVAPGEHVLGVMSPHTMIAIDNPTALQSDGLFLGSGTSEATAITSGVAAAYLSEHPGSTPLEVKTALRVDARPLCTWASGAGYVSMSPSRYVHGCGYGGHRRGTPPDPTGEASFNPVVWQANSWLGGAWIPWLASSWSASSWSASSWSASSWSASSWSASSWSASSWSASSWSDEGWGQSP